jgi:hypothetical protein
MQVYAYRVFETGRSNLTMASLARLAFGFEVDATEFLQPAPAPAPRPRGRPARPLPPSSDAVPTATSARSEASPESSVADREGVYSVSPREGDGMGAIVRDPGVHVAADGGGGPADAVRTRIVSVKVVVPSRRIPVVRDAVVAVLQLNAEGLFAREVIEAVRDAGHKRLPADTVHLVLHDLHRRGLVTRDGERGAFVYRLKAT